MLNFSGFHVLVDRSVNTKAFTDFFWNYDVVLSPDFQTFVVVLKVWFESDAQTNVDVLAVLP